MAKPETPRLYEFREDIDNVIVRVGDRVHAFRIGNTTDEPLPFWVEYIRVWDGALAAARDGAEGLSRIADHQRERAEAAEQSAAQLLARLETHTLHHLFCNADHTQPVGGDMCICIPGKFRQLEKDNAQLRAELEAARACINSAEPRIDMSSLSGAMWHERYAPEIEAAGKETK